MGNFLTEREKLEPTENNTLPEIPETNIAPENRSSQKESSIPTIHFQGQTAVSFRECMWNKNPILMLVGVQPPPPWCDPACLSFRMGFHGHRVVAHLKNVNIVNMSFWAGFFFEGSTIHFFWEWWFQSLEVHLEGFFFSVSYGWKIWRCHLPSSICHHGWLDKQDLRCKKR